MVDPAESFVGAVKEFCGWVETEPTAEQDEIRVAIRLLASLYAKVLELHAGEFDFVIDSNRISDEEWSKCFKRFGFLPFNYYRVFSNPADLDEGEPGIGDLADDLADIYRDLKCGLVLYQQGYKSVAVQEWRNSFLIHWGQHAASALYALHAYASSHSIRI